MLKIGITGGIGSGKTTVCKIFEVLDIPVYYADQRARDIVDTDTEIKERIKDLLGDQMYLPNGKLDRKKVAHIVFNFPELLEQYNAIIHPAVFADAERWMLRHKNYDYVIKEAALLFETGSNKTLDMVICVSAPKEVKIARIMNRDHITREQVLARMENQMDDTQKEALSDYIIYNDGSTPLIRQVLQIHEKLMAVVK
ncbi:MAG: dephospho-CoA kinase [Chitinophagales bacterium]